MRPVHSMIPSTDPYALGSGGPPGATIRAAPPPVHSALAFFLLTVIWIYFWGAFWSSPGSPLCEIYNKNQWNFTNFQNQLFGSGLPFGPLLSPKGAQHRAQNRPLAPRGSPGAPPDPPQDAPGAPWSSPGPPRPSKELPKGVLGPKMMPS